MRRALLSKRHDVVHLRRLLALIFVALAVPTGVLIWHAYGQLKWEAFHQYRISAEDLTRRIDSELSESIRRVDARSFSDYSFLVVAGDANTSFLQRSPLAEFPVSGELPGVLGHFQVDAQGAFSTPLLPAAGTSPESVGITPAEYQARLARAQQLQSVLAANRLVRRSMPVDPRAEEEMPASVGTIEGDADSELGASPAAIPPAESAYSQQVFDELIEMQSEIPAGVSGERPYEPADTAARDRPSAENRLQKVPAMKVDVLFQDNAEARESGRKDALPRAAKRREQTNLPEPVNTPRQQADASLAAATGDVRITTFESEVDPFEFSLLDSGHFVLFRKVWRDEQRYIQGMLIDAGTFLQQSIDANYDGSLAARAANLLIAYNDGILYPRDAAGAASYATAEFDGTLLYRDRLSVPLDPLELVFAVNKLPPGPGATVLAWVSLLLAAVFVAGFFALYRLGEGQIALARQQQDFVAAVSHELKTPLTSIRMYGEMLKEGWASEDRKQTYYDFIHDESERLTRLISNILQLARITRNEPQFDRKPVTVDELMSQLESKIATQAKRASVTVSYDCDEQCAGVSLDMDADCFAQIMINLVDNAIKFSRDAAKRQIDIACRRSSDGAVEFSVRDYGPGIARDQMQKIFELFYRSESELTRETAGTGIGLAIVMQLAAAMGGSVDLLNRDPGAEFSVSFPAA